MGDGMKVATRFEPALCVRDFDRMLGFYRDTLGMSVFSIDDISAAQSSAALLCNSGYRVARLETSGHDRLKLLAPVDSCARPAQVPFALSRGGFAYLTFIVPDLAHTMDRVRSAGGKITTGDKPVDFRPGVVKLAFVQDPEGNLLEFVERNDLAQYRPEEFS